MSAVLSQLFAPTVAEDRTMNFANAAMGMIQNEGPVTMEVPGLFKSDIDAARQGLERFDRELSRAEQARWQLHLLRDPKYDEPDDGAIRKEPPADWKLFFHYRRDLAEQLKVHGIELNQWQQDWFESMHDIWHKCTTALDDYALELDRLCPGYHFSERHAHQGTNLNVLRILRYVPHAGILAKEHTDRAGITFHIAESEPGLRSLKGRKVREERTPETPNVLVFAGDQLDAITRGEIQHCWHTVEDTTDGTAERFAMVFFGKFWTGPL
jgi:isopenicillin N synthase-like dioxygenase